MRRPRGPTAFLLRPFQPSLPEIHDVIGRHFRQLAGSERGQFEWLVLFPISALEMKICTQEIVDSLRGSPHIIVRLARSVLLLVVLPRSVKLCEVFKDL